MAEDKPLSEQIEEILTDCYDEEEVASAWGVAFEDGVAVPFSATLLGAPVEVRGFRVNDAGIAQCLAVRDKRQRWISVLDLDEEELPPDMTHVLTLYRAWGEGDY